MNITKRRAVTFTVIALLLCALQAGIWMRSTAHARSQTDVANKESQHPPTEIPGIAGLSLLIAVGVLVSIPQPHSSE